MTRDLTNTIGYVYKITSPSGKIYIGQTINLKNRKTKYKTNACKAQSILYNSIIKYGWDAHKFEIIEECLCGDNKSNLNEREIYWIAFYDSFKNGLNCTLGGGSNMGRICSEETKEKLRQANIGKKQTKETKEKKRQASSGMKNHFYGKEHSEETKVKIGKSKKGIKQTDETINKRIEKLKGRKNSEETIQKMKNSHEGKIISEETKEKMRQAKKGKSWSEARRKVQELKQNKK